MLRRDWLKALAGTSLGGRLGLGWPGGFAGGSPRVVDAAAVYRRGFAWSRGLAPRIAGLLIDFSSVAIDDPEVDDLIRGARPALEAIREAASIDRCDWGPEILTPDDLGKDRLDIAHINLVRVACLSARRLARLGRGREALGDLFAALTLAHRVGTGGVLFARVLECGAEVVAFRTLGRILPGLDRRTLDDLAGRLEALPGPEPASATIGPESRFILGSHRLGVGKLGPRLEGEDWAEAGFGGADAEVLARSTGGDRALILAHLDANGPAFDDLARRLDLPRPLCRAALDRFAELERASHPIAAGLVEAAWGVRHVVDRMRAYRSMMDAALALVRDGEPAFLAVPDPFGDGPHGLEWRSPGAASIRSALVDEGRPGAVLEVGDPGSAVPSRVF